jgi:hypothetical protein
MQKNKERELIKGEKTMRIYEVRHRCGCMLLKVDKSYKGGAILYCKKCHIEVNITKTNRELKFELEPEPKSQSQNQSQLVRT